MKNSLLGIAFASVALAGCAAIAKVEQPNTEVKQSSVSVDDENKLISHLSANSFITKDIDASADFYKKYLGYIEDRRTRFPASLSGKIYGYAGDEMMDFVVLVPPVWTSETDEYPGLSFMEFPQMESLPLTHDVNRAGLAGEMVMTFNVEDIEKLYQLLKEDGVEFVSPLTLSASGKSKTLTVLDPNGVRVYIYGYIKKD